MTMTPELLAKAGEALTGDTEEWSRALARALGAYHPDGPRETIDPRSVSRWRNGSLEILPWVGEVLPRLLMDEADALEAHAERLRDAAEEITQELIPRGPRR